MPTAADAHDLRWYRHHRWPRRPPARHRRWLLLPVGALLGGAAAFVTHGTSGCVYHGGSCPNPSPYECATGDYGDEGCGSEGDAETGTGDSGLDETGSDTSGGLLDDIDAFVDCHGLHCEIDETFARQLYLDPSPLLDDDTRLVYDSKLRRHVLQGVEPGSLAHALGLRTNDVLEAIDEMIISDLDSALHAYAQLAGADAVKVLVRRETRWLSFTYTFVQ